MLKPVFAFIALAASALPALGQSCDTRAAHWSYDGSSGPACWGIIEAPENLMCGQGREQSPVVLNNLIRVRDTVEDPFTYAPVPLSVTHNGHTVLVPVPPGQSYTARQFVWIEGGQKLEVPPLTETFELKQIHFHSPSEHTVPDEVFRLEAHMVHESASGKKLVRAMLFREGATPHPFLTQLLAGPLPAAPGQTTSVPGKSVHPKDLYGAAGPHVEYMGSLTTPDCAQGVIWRISSQPATATKEQIDAIRTAIGFDNARPVQKVHNRELLLWNAPNH